jgi:tetratricopeptide (TPR) repeat protein
MSLLEPRTSDALQNRQPNVLFVPDGETWRVGYAGRTFSVKASKGLSYIYRLLGNPGQEFHSLDLSSGSGVEFIPEENVAETHSADSDLTVGRLGDAGEKLDVKAKQNYKRRLALLREKLEDAREVGNSERQAEIEYEINFLTRELARAVGLGGRDRRAGSVAERARLNVTRAIKAALSKISERHEPLGELLEKSIKTGTFCSFSPDLASSVYWQLSTGAAAQPVLAFATHILPSRLDAGLIVLAERTRLVGREAERARLLNLLDHVVGGEERTAMIAGHAGIGKTRLAVEIFAEAAAKGFVVLDGNCYERDDSVPFVPIVEILEKALVRAASPDAFREALGHEVGEIARLVPQLPRVFTDIPPALEVPPEQSRRVLFDAVTEFLIRTASNSPLLLLFEDLHWADEGTISLITHIGRAVRNRPIMIIGTFRDNELSAASPLARSLEDLTRLHLLERIDLQGLPPPAVSEMIRTLSGREHEEPSSSLVDAIYSGTEGNPFFIEELYKHLSERGRLSDFGRGARRSFKLDSLDLPDSLRLIIGRRIARLTEPTRKMLTTSAIIGRSFTFRLLEAATHTDTETLLDCVEEAENAGIFSSTLEYPDSLFRFSHELIQQTVLSGISILRRQRIHLSVANAIERLHGTCLEDHAEDLAHHLVQAGTISGADKTVGYLVIAAERALAKSAFKEAEERYRQALGILATLPETPDRIDREFNLQYELWYLVGFTSGPTTDKSIREAERLRELGEKTSNLDRLILMLLAIWVPTFNRGELTSACQIGAQIQQVAERSSNSVGLTLAHATQGASLMLRGELRQAMQHYDAAIASYKEADFSGSPLDQHVQVLIARNWISWHMGHGDQARAKLREAISWSEHSKYAAIVADSLKYASFMYLDLRESSNLQKAAERLITVAKEAQLADHLVVALVCCGWALAEQGCAGEGIELIRDGLVVAHDSGLLEAAVFLCALSEAQGHAGQLEEALATIEQALLALGERQFYLPSLLWRRGELHLRHGEESKADADLREAIAVARRIGSKAYELRSTTSLARLLRDTNRRDEARAKLAEIYNCFTEGFDTADLKDAKALLNELNA